MKRMLMLMNILLAISLSPVNSETSDFRVGFFELPFHTKNVDGMEGHAIRHFRIILQEMNEPNVRFYQFPLPRLIRMLEEDKIDMILFMGHNDERAKKFIYSKIPLFYMEPCLALKNGKLKNAITSLNDILDLKIGTYKDGFYVDWLLDPRLKIQPITGDDIIERSIHKILAGRIDAFYSPDMKSVSYVINEKFPLEQIELMKLPVHHYGAYSVFSKKSANKYKSSYENALIKIQRTHPYAMHQ